MKVLLAVFVFAMSSAIFAQTPPIEPGVSQELARWRAARYSDVRYKLNLTLEKMSPVLKGTMEIRVRVTGGVEEKRSGGAQPGTQAPSPASPQRGEIPPIILDWRRIRGHEEKSTISNVTVNGKPAVLSAGENHPVAEVATPLLRKEGSLLAYREENEHLIFRDGVVAGENVIKLDFTSPILTSGSAITRYVDKEDGSEYIYSLFVPSDASTAFPVFDQPDLKARFEMIVTAPATWKIVSNSGGKFESWTSKDLLDGKYKGTSEYNVGFFEVTKPISTYVFAFAAGPWEKVSMAGAATQSVPPAVAGGSTRSSFNAGTSNAQSIAPTSTSGNGQPPATAGGTDSTAGLETFIYVRKSQAAKFKPHAGEVFRLNREAVKYFEQYFDYKFPFPKYDLVLIPEFPFGGMEHAGATFLRESSIIFPQEPTKNDLVSRATLIFHEAAHQWFGDTVTMRWFDDLWLKEGFATFTAYKALEKIMPEMNAWKVFYERIKQGAYQTDSTRGTTAIYQPIANLSAAKSAYGNIVYNKAPAFLRQAEFYLGEDKFQTAVRVFLKKHEFGNAGWEDLVREFEVANGKETVVSSSLSEGQKRWVKQYESSIGTDLTSWAERWVIEPEVFRIRIGKKWPNDKRQLYSYFYEKNNEGEYVCRPMKFRLLVRFEKGKSSVTDVRTACDPLLYDPKKFYFEAVDSIVLDPKKKFGEPLLIFANYGDYGYGIFLLDEKSREYVLKNIRREKDPFLRTMMWGALWDSVREGELDPRVFVELVVTNLGVETDESTIASLLGRTGTALNYYLSEPGAVATGLPAADGAKRPIATAEGSDKNDLRSRVEELLVERMRTAPSLGQRITYYRALLNIAASENARGVLKTLLAAGGNPSSSEGAPKSPGTPAGTLPTGRVTATAASDSIPLKTKDRFDIVTRLLILGDTDAPKLLADLEKTETSDDAKRYAYAARAGIGTAENKAKYWNDFVSNKEMSESWIEAAFGPWNSIRHSEMTLPYLERALRELPNHKRNRKIFFVNGWLGAFVGGQRSAEALAVVNKFLADNPGLDNDLRLKILENVDLIERAVNIRRKFPQV